MLNQKLSWKPVRKGETYCSPACGRGCTHKEFQEAMDKAANLSRNLGSGWMMHVHENLGWHYTVFIGDAQEHSRGVVEVNEYWGAFGKPSYTVYIQTTPQFVWTGDDVKALIKKGLKQLDEHIEQLEKARASVRVEL